MKSTDIVHPKMKMMSITHSIVQIFFLSWNKKDIVCSISRLRGCQALKNHKSIIHEWTMVF